MSVPNLAECTLRVACHAGMPCHTSNACAWGPPKSHYAYASIEVNLRQTVALVRNFQASMSPFAQA